MKSDLKELYEELMGIYVDLKRDVRIKNHLFYERWKAGGFRIDEDVLDVVYPNLGEMPELADDYEEEDDDDDDDDEDYEDDYENRGEEIE